VILVGIDVVLMPNLISAAFCASLSTNGVLVAAVVVAVVVVATGGVTTGAVVVLVPGGVITVVFPLGHIKYTPIASAITAMITTNIPVDDLSIP
jgi:hypothetical protein